MKVLITGADGQLGYDLQKVFASRGIETIPTDVGNMDITDKPAVLEFMQKEKPDAVIHAAAWTAVDAAEENKEACFRINAEGTANVAEAAAAINARLIYISTDYVFDGSGTAPWKPESTVTHPLNVYGASKYEGEKAVRKSCKDNVIVRISWVFGKNGKNFIKTMLNLGKDRKELTVVDDQIGSPTYTHDLAPLLADMIASDKTGIYHATNTGYCSWYELAEYVFKIAREYDHNEYDDVHISPVSSSEYKTKAKRPMNSRMDSSRLTADGFSLLPPWQDAVRRFLKELDY